ncbi:MAG: glycosyltransferase family 39 protein [Kiritimatiellaeota bacterium]|nr:glycosyltransferase family 39 protein [Kiritimatiellota bacterium]
MAATIQMGARERAAVLALLALFCAFGLFDHALWSANDTREGAVIAEMVRTGDWAVPRLNGVPDLEKPPLLHWTGALLCRLAGTVSAGLVRLPAALYGFGALLLIWRLGVRLGRERAGLLAAFLCATSLLFAEYTRIVLTDAALMCMVLLALDLFWGAYTAECAQRSRYALFLLASAASFYAKGLLGPGFIWLSVGLFLLARREWKLLFQLALMFLPIFLLLLAPWVWALAQAGGRPFLVSVFWDNQFGRFFTFSDPALPKDPFFVHKEPFYYYFGRLPVRLLPWTLLVAGALARWFRRATPYRGALPLFLRCALVAMLLLLQVSAAKTACYVLPLFPLLFLMTGLWLEDALQPGGANRWERGLLALTGGALALLTLLAPLGLIAARMLRWTWGGSCWWPGAALADVSVGMAVFAGLVGCALLAWLRQQWRVGRPEYVAWHGPLALVVVLALNGGALLPVLDVQRTYQPVAELVRQNVGPAGRLAFASYDERDLGAFAFYLQRRLDILSADEELFDYLHALPPFGGVILPAEQLHAIQPLIAEGLIRVVRPLHPGYKARDYVLLVPAPPAPPDQQPSETP